MQNMLKKGNDKPSAEKEADFLARLARYLGHARLTADDRPVQKPSDELPLDARIEAAAAFPWVSRGGVKLAHALDALAIDATGNGLKNFRERMDAAGGTFEVASAPGQGTRLIFTVPL